MHERFNLHASVRVPAHDDLAREGWCRYLARPAFSLARLGVRVARAVAEDGFDLNRGVLVCRTGNGAASSGVTLFAAREPRALEHLASALGVSLRLPTSCRGIDSSPGFIVFSDDLAHYRPAQTGGRMRARLQPLPPDVSPLESPHIVYFAFNEGEEGAVAFFMPAGPMMPILACDSS